MPGTILTDDNFTGVADGTTISGRLPPVAMTSSTYVVDPNTAGVTGDGNGNVKFSTSGACAKIRCDANGAVQVVFDDKGANEDYSIFLRDTASTPYPRYGYVFRFRTRIAGAVGEYNIMSQSNYNSAFIQPYEHVPWTFSSNGINTIAFEAINNDFRVIINNVVAASFTNSLFPSTDSYASKVGIVYHSANASVGRLDRFTFYDSILVSESQEFPIVRFS